MTVPQFILLSIIEYFTLILIMFRVSSERYNNHARSILVYAPIYLIIVLLRFTAFEFIDSIILIMLFASVVAFIMIAFNETLGKAMLLSLVTTFIFWILLQIISIVLLTLYFTEPLEFSFNNGLKATSLSLIIAKLCYLWLPLERIVQNLLRTKRYIQYTIAFVAIVAFLYFVLTSVYVYVELLYPYISILFIYLITAGISSAAFTACYYAIKYVLELREKKSALNKLEFYENYVNDKGNVVYDFEKHFNIVKWLSHINDNEKTEWYVETEWDDFYDMENTHEDGARMLPLIEFPDKVLAAYLYVKVKHLRSLGIKSWVGNNYLFPSLPKNTNLPKLIEALDILIDEIVAATDKERSDIRIVLHGTLDNRMVIKICNNRHLLIEQEANRMLTEAYSIKTRKSNDLKKLHAISKKNKWKLNLKEGKRDYWDKEDYLEITYTL